MDRCFILGCSQAAGLNMANHMERYDLPHNRFYDQWTYGYHHSYPAHIARGLGYVDIRNHAVVSGSNDAMLRIFKELVDSMQADQDIVIACWTSMDRSEYYDLDQQSWIPLMIRPEINYPVFVKSSIALQGLPMTLATSDRYKQTYRQWVMSFDAESAKKKSIRNIIELNDLADQKQIKVCNIFSFLSHELESTDEIELARWWWPIGVTNTFETFAESQGYTSIDGCGHYDEDVHKSFADFVLTNINGRP